MSPLENVNIASPAFKANPYPFYARLRAEAPVYRVTLPDKLLAMIFLLLIAGHETTVNLIGNGMLALMRPLATSPDQDSRAGQSGREAC
jgi:hypothetical protein